MCSTTAAGSCAWPSTSADAAVEPIAPRRRIFRRRRENQFRTANWSYTSFQDHKGSSGSAQDDKGLNEPLRDHKSSNGSLQGSNGSLRNHKDSDRSVQDHQDLSAHKDYLAPRDRRNLQSLRETPETLRDSNSLQNPYPVPLSDQIVHNNKILCDRFDSSNSSTVCLRRSQIGQIPIRSAKNRSKPRKNLHSVHTKRLLYSILITVLAGLVGALPSLPQNGTDPVTVKTSSRVLTPKPSLGAPGRTPESSLESAGLSAGPNVTDKIVPPKVPEPQQRPNRVTPTTFSASASSRSPTKKQEFYSTLGVPVYAREENFFYRDAFSSIYTIKIGKDSWNAYSNFKKETCRNDDELPIDGQVLNNTDSGYFSWEENVFHHELRKIILPETRSDRLTPLIGSTYLRALDPRFFMSTPKSMCRAQSYEMDLEELQKLERQHFEDYLINKIFAREIWMHDSNNNNSTSNNTINNTDSNESAASGESTSNNNNNNDDSHTHNNMTINNNNNRIDGDNDDVELVAALI